MNFKDDPCDRSGDGSGDGPGDRPSDGPGDILGNGTGDGPGDGPAHSLSRGPSAWPVVRSVNVFSSTNTLEQQLKKQNSKTITLKTLKPLTLTLIVTF